MMGFISNQRTSALIDKTSIVWFPVPKFDSPSVFTKLLDDDGGEFTIIPQGEIKEIRQYYEHPLVLTTDVIIRGGGRVKITDLLPLGETIIIRKVESDVPFKVLFKPVFKYALYRPIIVRNRFINSKGRDCIAFLYKWEGKVKRLDKYTWKFSGGKGYLVANYSTDVEHGAMSERGKVLNMDFEKPFENTIKFWEDFNVEGDHLYKTSVYVLLGSIYSPSGATIASVCPYTFISIILCSFMIECRDLALNHLPNLTVGGSWDSFEPNGTGLTSPALLAKLYSATTSLCHLSFPFSQTPTLGASPPSGW